MKSLDTNILLYATDEDCREHDAAIRLVNEALRSPAEWMLADQALVEMYAPFLPVPLFDPGAKMSGKNPLTGHLPPDVAAAILRQRCKLPLDDARSIKLLSRRFPEGPLVTAC